MDHTISLIRKSHHGDKEAREQLVKENVGLVWCVVKRFYGRGAEPEDLFQIGSIGLLKAIDKFDLSYDVQFSTYAVPMISGEIRRFLRDDGMIKVSRSLKKLSYKCGKKKEELTERMGREPTLEELATSLGTEKEELVQAMEAATEVESIYRPIHQEGDSQLSILDRLEEKSRPEEHLLNRMMLSQILDGLDKEERQLIYLRYFQEKTQSVIAKEMGISQVQVSRMEKRILKKMTYILTSEILFFKCYILTVKNNSAFISKKCTCYRIEHRRFSCPVTSDYGSKITMFKYKIKSCQCLFLVNRTRVKCLAYIL